jgi:DNA-binding MarR family transcriptional regulator
MLTERPCNLSELAEYQGVSLPTMSGSISRLETRGWVERKRSTIDRRIVMVELTPKGQQRLAQMLHQAETYLSGLMEKLSPTERETLAAGLTVLQKLFD